LAETNLKAQLQNMIKLQEIDSEIYKLKNQKESKPLELKAIEAAFEDKKQVLVAMEKSMLDFLKQRKDKEMELGLNEENRKKLQGQLFSLKTNKEYQTMLQQIEDTKADASVIEDKILQLFEKADKLKAEIDQEKQKLQVEEKTANEAKKKIEELIKEIDASIATHEAQRKQVLPSIDTKILAQYEKILQNKEGLAIVGVKNNSCMGCNMFVPPQVENLVKMYDRLITCEMCNRILYMPDEES